MTNPVAMGQRLRGIRACVFDAYGTLFDVASAAQRCSGELGEITPRLAALWRDKQLQYSWLRTVQGHHADFWQVTGDALDFALDSLGIADPDLRERLMLLYLTLDAYPEVSGVLRQLRDVGFATTILSNGSPAMLTAAVDHAGLGAMFDHFYPLKTSASTSRIQAPIDLHAIISASLPAPSLSCRRMVGTPGRPRPMPCAFSGAIGSVRSASGCLAAPTARSAR